MEVFDLRLITERGQFGRILLKKSARKRDFICDGTQCMVRFCAFAPGLAVGRRSGPVTSCDCLHLGCPRSQSGELSQVLGDGGEKELVLGSIWASQPQPRQVQDTLQVGKQHLHLFAFVARYRVGFRLPT